MSLVELAEQKNLPLHQYMDAETVQWIAANNPFSGETGDKVEVSQEDVELLRTFAPLKEWFLVPELADSIHGTRHLLRVGFHSILLSNSSGLQTRDRINLLTAAVLHDVRREDDKGDMGHGERAAEWFLLNSRAVANQFQVEYDNRDIGEIYAAMLFHDMTYEDMSDNSRYAESGRIVDLMKAADGLDRYRLPKLKWWFDQARAKVQVAPRHARFAYGLVLGSERRRLMYETLPEFKDAIEALSDKWRQKMVVILQGGNSEEREASVYTGEAVMRELSLHGIVSRVVDPAVTDVTKDLGHDETVFSCLHGGYGEDGRIAGILDYLCIPHAFSGTLASAVTMDKLAFKAVVEQLGFLTPRSVSFGVFPSRSGRYIHKTIGGGGIIGMRVDDNPDVAPGEFTEEFIPGRILTLGILEREGQLFPLEIVEVKLIDKVYYDQDSKYEEGHSTLVAYDGSRGTLINEQSVCIFKRLGIRSAARIDLIEDADGELYFLEINYVPGMYPDSNLVTSARLAGLSFFELLLWILESSSHEGSKG
jgi:D-alanine-D-alanine ligase-like ATP-grasp enzyme